MAGRRRIYKCYGIVLTCVGVVIACKPDKKSTDKFSLRQLEGGIYGGGVLTYYESAFFTSIYPLSVKEVVGAHIAAQIYEGLTRLNPRSLEVEPGLAESWEIDSTGTRYVFKLRKDVYFHDDGCFPGGKGRLVTAYDVEWALKQICKPSGDNLSKWLFEGRVKGCTEHYMALMRGEKTAVEPAIKATDSFTLEIELERPVSFFLDLLAMPNAGIYPREAREKYGVDMRVRAVGTGPFMVDKVDESEKTVILKRNPKYWRKDKWGNQLPYIDRIVMRVIPENKMAFLEFTKGRLAFVDELPLELIPEILNEDGTLKEEYKRFEWETEGGRSPQRTPELALYYLGFLTTASPFNDVRVRKAFNYAVDREAIVNGLLHGVGIPARYGVVPPALVGYEARQVEGYTYNPEKAKKLLAEAGYPNGEGFPEVTLIVNSGGGRNIQIAGVVQRQLAEVLNINIKIETLPWDQHLDKIEKGEAKFFRLGWIADYPDPSTFLMLFHSKYIGKEGERSYINVTRFSDSRVDELIDRGFEALTREEAYGYYQKADQAIIDQAPIIPLYYYERVALLQPNLRNFWINPLHLYFFGEVYFVPGDQQKGT